MSTDVTMKTTLDGNKAIARITKKVLPIIELYFKPFDGQRAHISSGPSAKFKEVTKAFYAACEALELGEGVRVWIDGSNYSLFINLDIRIPDPEHEHWNYYKDYVYVGQYHGQEFKYACDIEQNKAAVDRILKTTLADIRKAKKQIDAAKRAIEAAEDLVPHEFRDLIV